MYFFSTKKLTSYHIKTSKVVSSPLSFDPEVDLIDKVEIHWSSGYLYLFLIIEQTLHIRKLDPPGGQTVLGSLFLRQLLVRTYDLDLNGKIPHCLTSTLISPDKVQLCVQLSDPGDEEDKYPTQILQYCFSTDEVEHICDGPLLDNDNVVRIVAVPSYLC